MKVTLHPGHVYRDASGTDYAGVTDTLKAAGIIDATWFNEYARLRGEYVHLACAIDDRGELDDASVDPVIAPYLEAWRKFRRESGYTPEHTERIVWDESWRFAGTLDSYGDLNGEPTIIDRKTGACPTWGGLQLAAYAFCVSKSDIIQRRVCELHGDGTYKLVPFDDRNDLAVFLAALMLARWRKTNQ